MSTHVQPRGTQNDPVPMTVPLTYKFYEPVVLLKALNDDARRNASPGSTPSSSSSSELDLEDADNLFQAFVYKLAHVCDSDKGRSGATITSFMVLRSELPESRDDIVHYYFASNYRNIPKLKETRAYVHALLRKIGLAPEDADPYRSNMLRDIICFNQGRLRYYLTPLSRNVEECQQRLEDLFGADSAMADTGLARILTALRQLQLEDTNMARDAGFAFGCERVMRRLTRFERSPAGQAVAEHVREIHGAEQSSEDCWHQLQHAMSRILAYPKSLACMLKARRRWPVLFNRYRVFYIPSSKFQDPLNGRPTSFSAEGIVGRLTRRVSDIEKFREYVKDLQIFDLDARIKAEFVDGALRPLVHSEVLLLNFLEFSDGGVTEDRFFQGSAERMYIGSSKPLCRLCKYYFEAHPAGVGHRTTHGNLYKNWRFPDVLVSHGQRARDGRIDMLDKVLKRIRADAFRLIMDRIDPSGKHNDSNTFSANVSLRDDLSTVLDFDDMDEITSILDGASLGGGHDERDEANDSIGSPSGLGTRSSNFQPS
ncbi:uncharacterized protein B0I36DRAFT_359766 [Microdochium trichocladiopsis]|uniref:Uncharacterized protein n=1 Tax=Microdochium trichocladiopsis TaxID=1682393 RepID=A0A9P9BYL8_9PEZI|nr:uncharacterized protein B0I36DRAFT_359766 [Microdochium trichocladiopsis]KAH7038173.1 hypothetical protein B0I36DRAFT_359766 [Microdochium trichocladiopsis]